jgi:hypothetical protein
VPAVSMTTSPVRAHRHIAVTSLRVNRSNSQIGIGTVRGGFPITSW